MLKRKWWFVASFVLIVSFAGCSCKDDEPVDACQDADCLCPDPLAGPYDLPAGDGTQTVFTKTITEASDLIGGAYAQGQIGDTLVYNDNIRFIIQGVGDPTTTLAQFGGNIIDADIQRGTDPGQDRFGELMPLIHLGKTMNPDTIVVMKDGSDGGPVQVKVCGSEATVDFFNLKALVTGFGITLAFDPLADYGQRISNTYTLAPGSNNIHITTTLGNPTGADFHTVFGDISHTGATQETFINNNLGWGEGGIDGALALNPPTRWQAFVSPQVTYGLVPSTPTQIALDVSGVNAMAYGFETAIGIFSAEPIPGEPGVVTVPKGRRASYHRTLVVADGGDASAVTDAHYELLAVPDTVVRTGTVTEDDGTTPLPGARVTLLNVDDTRAEVSFESDSEGNYGGRVPAGDYYVVADVEGRGIPTFVGLANNETVETRFDQNTLPTAEISLDGAVTTLPDITFPQPSTLDFVVTDITVNGTGLGTPLPAKVVITGTDPSPRDSVFRDPRKDGFPSGIVRYAHIGVTGTLAVPIEPGTFDVYVSRGPEFSAFTQQVVVTAGTATPVVVELDRVVDSTGWLSVDSHIHLEHSPDSRVQLDRRVLSTTAEDVDLLVTTDHDFVTDVSSNVTALGLDAFVKVVIGEEITTWDYGHFNAFPLTLDPTSISGGALDWMGGLGPVNNMTTEEIFTAVQAQAGTQVEQVNHPRGSDFQAYFKAIGLDTLTLESKVAPIDRRIPDPAGSTAQDTGLFYAGFNAMEVVNGTSQGLDRTNSLLNDWFTFLSHGLRVTGVGVSDTHNQYQDQVGWARTWVNVGANDTPATADLEEVAVAINAGNTVFGMGPFINVTVDDGAVGLAGPGETLLNASTADLTLHADLPLWVEVDTVQIYANTVDTVAAAGTTNENAPAFVCELPVVQVAAATGNGTAYNTVDLTTDLTAGACDVGANDVWVVVKLFGAATTSMFPYVHEPQVRAESYSNAIFLDRDSSGAYAATGPVVTSSARPLTPDERPTLDLERLGPELTGSELEDVRAAFHNLTCH